MKSPEKNSDAIKSRKRWASAADREQHNIVMWGPEGSSLDNPELEALEGREVRETSKHLDKD